MSTGEPTFDQLALERTVRLLSKTGIRRAPLTLERIKAWVKQFEGSCEKTLAWLILRNLIYRNNEQLESSMRQALKAAALHFMSEANLPANVNWRNVLRGGASRLSFYCGPPSLDGSIPPGKSGELMTRSVHRSFGVPKWYASDISVFQPNERYLVVDDGSFTGRQLIEFLEGWRPNYQDGKVALVVGMAHMQAIRNIASLYPTVPFFAGETLTESNCFAALCREWTTGGQWPHSEPVEDVYRNVCARNGPFSRGSEANGFGSLGVLVAYEHGIPDNSLQLLWDRSATWIPLVER